MKLWLFPRDITLYIKCVMAPSWKTERTCITHTLNINKAQVLFFRLQSKYKPHLETTACTAMHTRPLISGLCPPFQHTFRHTFLTMLYFSQHTSYLSLSYLWHAISFALLSLLQGHHVLTSFKALITTCYNCFLTSLRGKDYSQFLIPTIYHNTLFAVGT